MQRKRQWLHLNLQILPWKSTHVIFISSKWNRSTTQWSLLNLVFRLKRKLFSLPCLSWPNSILTLKQKLHIPTLICLVISRCDILINFINDLIMDGNWDRFLLFLRLIHHQVLLEVLRGLGGSFYVVASEFQVFKVREAVKIFLGI